MAPWQTNLLACPRNCYGPNRPPIESIHPPNSQQPATKQARRASTQTIQKRVFLFTILRRLKHRKRQRALRACRTDCRNRANNTDAAPKNELAALGGRKPKEIKYYTTGVAGVEALPSSAWQASKHCPGAASHVSRSSLLLRGVRAAPPRIGPPRLRPPFAPRHLPLEPRRCSF